MTKATQASLNHGFIFETISDIYHGELNEKRVLSLANAVQGSINSASLAIHAIGHGLAVAQGEGCILLLRILFLDIIE